jgi:hypothetical protein
MIMNRTQAQFILGAHPPGGTEPKDPRYEEALAYAESDPVLREWLREIRGFDAVVCGKLERIAPPADLKDAILAGRRPVVTPARDWTRTILPWAIAALLAGMVAVFFPWRSVGDSGGARGFRTAAARFLTDEWAHDFDRRDRGFPALQEWAATRTAAARLEAPQGLRPLPTFGCKVFQWRGHEAFLICFSSGEDGQLIHLVSVDRAALPEASPMTPGSAEPARAGEWNTLTWSSGGRVYVALSTMEPDRLLREVGPIQL